MIGPKAVFILRRKTNYESISCYRWWLKELNDLWGKAKNTLGGIPEESVSGMVPPHTT